MADLQLGRKVDQNHYTQRKLCDISTIKFPIYHVKVGMFSLPGGLYMEARKGKRLHLGYICPFIQRCHLSTFLSPGIPAFLFELFIRVFTNSIPCKFNKHHQVGLASSSGVQKGTSKKKAPSCTSWCSQAVPLQTFLGGKVLMTIIIYSEDVLNFLS